MSPYSKSLDELQVHFILCTERSGSSLLSLMLNISPQVLSTSEEPFAVYFYRKYKNKTLWTEAELQQYVDEFWLMAEQSLGIFFTTKEKFLGALLPHRAHLPYRNLVKLTYLQFIEPKPKDGLKMIVDKQVKFFFYLPVICEIFPDAKFIILVRDVRDNIVAKSGRGLHGSKDAIYLSSIWKLSYERIGYLEEHNKQLHLVRYEDLVTDPAATLKKICGFLGVDFVEQMLDPSPFYKEFLQQREPFTDPQYMAYVKQFQSSLLAGDVDTKKIGIYRAALDNEVTGKVLTLNKDFFLRFGYEARQEKEVPLSLSDRWQVIRAKMRFPWLLRQYLAIPFGIKFLIKKIRNKPRI